MSNHDGRGQGRFIKGRSINTQLSIFWTCRVSLAPVLSMTKDIFWLLIHTMCLQLDALPPSLFLRAGWSGSRLSSLAKIASTIFVFLKWSDHSWCRTSSHGYWNFDDDLMCWFYWHNRPTLQKKSTTWTFPEMRRSVLRVARGFYEGGGSRWRNIQNSKCKILKGDWGSPVISWLCTFNLEGFFNVRNL